MVPAGVAITIVVGFILLGVFSIVAGLGDTRPYDWERDGE